MSPLTWARAIRTKEEKIPERLYETTTGSERAVLVGVGQKGPDGEWSLNDSLQELSFLAATAGAQVVGRVSQRLDAPSASHYIGKGKLEQLKALKERTGYDTAIFDDELSPRQQRNLEDALELKVLDRTALILDIFARHAHSREGKLQVQLAQHRYLLPRLAGQWSHLERLGGGIGTRGPGESQIETDRRLIRKRIDRLERELEDVRRHRARYRKRRKESGLPVVALVGYTNAGKSTLFNVISRAGVEVQDKLFSTLDPVTRRVHLSDGHELLITDTVGFIHKLPPSIIAAFRATLEELQEADLLLHIVDITHKNAASQYHTVEKTLDELGLGDKPVVTVFNKVDLVLPEEPATARVATVPFEGGEVPFCQADTALVSATEGWGIHLLLDTIRARLERHRVTVS